MTSSTKKRIVDRTYLREQQDAPFWSTLRWLKSQADWCASRLRDRCAIKLGGEQPRAALMCLPVTDAVFSLSIKKPMNAEPSSASSNVSLRPLCLANSQKLIKEASEARNQRHYGRKRGGGTSSGGPRVNKQSLRHDANISVDVSGKSTLEMLDLTVDPSTCAAFDRDLVDIFPRGSEVLIFDDPKFKHFGRLGEVCLCVCEVNAFAL